MNFYQQADYLMHTENHDDNFQIHNVVGENYFLLNASAREILKYFDDKTHGDRFACRQDIVPKDFIPHLCNVGLFDLTYDEDGNLEDILIRLMGTNVVEIFGEHTGENYTKLDDITAVDGILAVTKEILEQEQTMQVIALNSSYKASRTKISGVYIPLSEDNKRIDKIFSRFDIVQRYPSFK